MHPKQAGEQNMTLESSKTLGGAGALLLFVAATLFIISSFGLTFGAFGALALGVVGLILLLIGLNGIAGYFKDRFIFNQSLFAVIVVVIGLVVAGVVLVSVVLANLTPLLGMLYPGWNGAITDLPNTTPDPNALTPDNINIAALMPLLIGFVGVWVVVWITAIIATFLVRRSLVAIADKSSTKLFSTAGMIMLIGGFLGLVAIGYFLIVIGLLLLAVAFFQLQPTPPPEAEMVGGPPQATMM